jgi:hypothetical protein
MFDSTHLARQHTFIETTTVRYLYQPLEDLYVVVITSKASNILEDLETLRLFAKLVSEKCATLTENTVVQNEFELIFAFDEVITLGYKESVTLPTIQTYLAMDSHEERMKEIELKEQEKIVKRKMQERQAEISKIQAEAAKRGGGSGFGGGSSFAGMITGTRTAAPTAQPFVEKPAAPTPSPAARPNSSSGMKLGGRTAGTSLSAKILAEEGLNEPEASPSEPTQAAGAAASTPQEGIVVRIEEELIINSKNNGTVDQLEVRGQLTLIPYSEEGLTCQLRLAPPSGRKLQTKPHPILDKNQIKDGVLALKDQSRTFTKGAAVGLLQWRFTSTDEDDVPVSISCWPEVSPKGTACTMAYELHAQQLILEKLDVAIPNPSGQQPEVTSIDGRFTYNHKTAIINWLLDVVDADATSGNLEFKIPGAHNAANFFPINISYSSQQSFVGIALDSVLDKNGQPIDVNASCLLKVTHQLSQ